MDYYQLWLVNRWVEQGGDHVVYGGESQVRLGRFSQSLSSREGRPPRERRAAAQNLNLYEGRIEPYASPFLYSVLASFETGRYGRDLEIFTWLSILACAASIGLLGWAYGFPPWWTVAAIGVSLLLLPLRILLQVGNVAGLQLLGVAGFTALQMRRPGGAGSFSSGILIGLAIAFKPTAACVLLPPAVVWAVDLEWRRMLSVASGILVAALAAFASGSLYFGSAAVWSLWLTDLVEYLGRGPTTSSYNCSIPGLLKEACGLGLGLPVLVLLLGLVALGAWRTRPRKPLETAEGDGVWAARMAISAALGGASVLFVSPLVWYHYLVGAVPLVLWTWRPDVPRSRRPALYRTAALVALLALSLLAVELGLGWRFIELWLGNAAVALVTVLGFWDLFALGEGGGRPPESPREAFL